MLQQLYNISGKLVCMSSEKEVRTRRPVSGRFHVRPHLSAALLCRLISTVLARLLSALDDGELDDADLVALALAVDQSAFSAEVTEDRRRSRPEQPAAARPRTSSAAGTDKPHRRSVGTGPRKRECSLIAPVQVM